MFWNRSNKVIKYGHNFAMAFFASIFTALFMDATDFIKESGQYNEPIFRIARLIILLILMFISGQILLKTYDKFD